MTLLDMIAHRRGIGDLLADGVKRASAKVGKGSESFAMHSKGLELPGYDVRSLKTFAMGLAGHLRRLPQPLFGVRGRHQGQGRPLQGRAGPRQAGQRGRGLCRHPDCLVLCKFLRNCFSDFNGEVSRLYTMTTGIPSRRRNSSPSGNGSGT